MYLKRVRFTIILGLIFILFFVFIPESYASQYDYPMKSKDERRRAYIENHMFPYTYKMILNPNNVLAGTYASPIIVDNIAYMLGTETQRVVAYDIINEEVLWISSSLPGGWGQHPATPIIIENRLVVPAGRYVYILNKNTGSTIKRIQTYVNETTGRYNRFVSGPLHWRNGDVYIGGWHWKIYGINVLDSSTTPFFEYESNYVFSGAPVLMDRGSGYSDRIIFTGDGIRGLIVSINPSSRSVAATRTTDYGIAATTLTPDGITHISIDKRGKMYRYDTRTGSFTSYNSIHSVHGENQLMRYEPSYNPQLNRIFVGTNRLSDGRGYIYSINPSNGSYTQLYTSSQSINSGPVAISDGKIIFTLANGQIRSLNHDGSWNGWVLSSSGNVSCCYTLDGARSYSVPAIGGGTKKVLMINGAGGVYVFEPYYPNIHGMETAAFDESGNRRTTFKHNERIRLRGTFINNGTRAVSNVEHRVVINGVGTDVQTLSYSVNQRNWPDIRLYLEPGVYDVYFEADPRNRITMSDGSTKRTPTLRIVVEKAEPNLVSTGISVFNEDRTEEQYVFDYGDIVSVTAYFRNLGDAATDGPVNHTHSLNGKWQGNIRSVEYDVGQTRWITKWYDETEYQVGENTVFGIADYYNEHGLRVYGESTTFYIRDRDIEGYDTKVRDASGNERTTFYNDETIRLTGYFRNIGEVDVANYEVTYYLNDQRGNQTTLNIPVDQSRFWTIALENLPRGDYEVYFEGDPDQKVKESNRDNNKTPVVAFSVVNRPPISDFTVNPNPTNRLTDTQFTSNATDPDGDTLSHQWHYRKKGTSSWIFMSNQQNPSHRFEEVGTYEVRLQVTDPYGASDSIIKEVEVFNLSPVADFRFERESIYVMDPIDAIDQSYDPEGDDLEHLWTVCKPSGECYNETSVDITIIPDEAGMYAVTKKVTDEYGASDQITKYIQVFDLWIVGNVLHTEYWDEHRIRYNLRESGTEDYPRGSYVFWAGEEFVLEALTVRSETLTYAERVTVEMRETGVEVELTSSNNFEWEGVMWQEDFEQLPDGFYTFDFTAYYTNGVIRRDQVIIEIRGKWSDFFRFHRLK